MSLVNAEDTIVQLTAFMVGDEEYVVDILRVKEIIRVPDITPVRQGPKFVEGVINLRGQVIPVIDLRKRFGIEQTDSGRRRVVIMMVNERVLGLIVDRVTEVVRVERHTVQAAPRLLDSTSAPFFLGICHYHERMLILLNVKTLIDSDDEIDPHAAVAVGAGAQ